MLADLVAAGCVAEGSESVNNPLSRLGKSVLDAHRQQDLGGGSGGGGSSAQDALLPPFPAGPPPAHGALPALGPTEAAFLHAFHNGTSVPQPPPMAPPPAAIMHPPPSQAPMVPPAMQQASEDEIHAALRNLDISLEHATAAAPQSSSAHFGVPHPTHPPLQEHLGMAPPHPHFMAPMAMMPPPHAAFGFGGMPPAHMMAMRTHVPPQHAAYDRRASALQQPAAPQQTAMPPQPLTPSEVRMLDSAHEEAWRALASEHAATASTSSQETAPMSTPGAATENALEAAYLETVAHGLASEQARQQAEGPQLGELEEVWKSLARQERDAVAKGLGEGGADDLDAIWENLKGGDYEASWDDMWKNVSDVHAETTDANAPYTFHADNPHVGGEDLLARGTELFHRGELPEAILVLEAAVQARPEDTIAWQTLGQAHADADDDARAISCLRRAVAADPHNLNALLALGVSYTNELDQTRALEHLQRWLESHPDFSGLRDADAADRAAARKPFENPFELQRRVTDMFLQAVRHRPDNADLHAVLGVLYNLSRSYPEAVASFEAALRLRPEDYSLWNKLGATQANAMSCAEAVPCYVKALELKPQYVRALSNLGISYGNMADYEAAAQCYLKSLSLNREASHIWGYLTMTFTSMGRVDLVSKAQSGVGHEAFRGDFDF